MLHGLKALENQGRHFEEKTIKSRKKFLGERKKNKAGRKEYT